ncbi:MAG: AsmA family protein [Betaproteobacteria bacterium]|nr:MAG: AsmA family protein [Betaproteobacteria bacterium]
MKALKILAYGAGGFVALLLVALAVAVLVIDGGFVKARLEHAMQEKHRTLTIEGEPRIRLYPVAGIALGRLVLTEPASDNVFIALDSAEIALQTLPLLSREVAVEVLRISGLKLNVARAADGRLNFADLIGAGESVAGPERGELRIPAVRIAQIAIERARIGYRDAASGQEITLDDLDLKTGRLDGAAPGQVTFSVRLTGRRPELDIRAQAAGAVRFNLQRQEVGLDAFSLQVKGRADRDTLAVEIAAPKVDITPSRASGSAVAAAVKVSGPKRRLDAKLNIAAAEGTAKALSIPNLALELDASAEGRSVKGRVSTPLQANLAGPAFELPKIAAHLTLSGPGLPQKGLALLADAALKADFGKQSAAGELAARFEDSNLRARFAATRFAPLVATFDVKADRLNLDRLMPPKMAQAKGDDRIDLSGLKGPRVSGQVAIGALTAQRLKLADLKAGIKLAGGRLEVAPHSANLYGGTLSGSLVAHADGNRIAIKQAVRGVQLGPLLRDAAQQDRLEGRGNVTLDVATAGAGVLAMKQALGGTARVEMRDGAVKGINLAEAIQDVRAVLGSRSATASDPSKRTDFSEITASFVIKNGVAHNEDLQGKAPLLRLTGGGDVDIGNSTVNYTARAAVVATSRGQGGRDLSNLAGVTVPVRITGALEKPAIAVDFAELAAKSGVDLAKALGRERGVTEKIGDKLRGLFRR